MSHNAPISFTNVERQSGWIVSKILIARLRCNPGSRTVGIPNSHSPEDGQVFEPFHHTGIEIVQNDEFPVLIGSNAAVKANKVRRYPLVSSRMEAHAPMGDLGLRLHQSTGVRNDLPCVEPLLAVACTFDAVTVFYLNKK